MRLFVLFIFIVLIIVIWVVMNVSIRLIIVPLSQLRINRIISSSSCINILWTIILSWHQIVHSWTSWKHFIWILSIWFPHCSFLRRFFSFKIFTRLIIFLIFWMKIMTIFIFCPIINILVFIFFFLIFQLIIIIIFILFVCWRISISCLSISKHQNILSFWLKIICCDWRMIINIRVCIFKRRFIYDLWWGRRWRLNFYNSFNWRHRDFLSFVLNQSILNHLPLRCYLLIWYCFIKRFLQLVLISLTPSNQ